VPDRPVWQRSSVQRSEDIKLLLKLIYTGSISNFDLPNIISIVNELGMKLPTFEEEAQRETVSTELSTNAEFKDKLNEKSNTLELSEEGTATEEVNAQNDDLKFKCRECIYPATSWTNFRVHQNKSGHAYIKIPNPKSESKEKSNERNKSMNSLEAHNKELELAKFKNKENSNVHNKTMNSLKAHTKEFELVNGKAFNNEQRKNFKHKCNECNYTSENYRSLRAHKTEHNNKVFICESCEYISNKKSNFNAHRKKHTGGMKKKIHTCSACNYKTTMWRDMRKHIKSLGHSTEKKVYKCQKCDYTSDKKTHVNIHMTKHSDCNLCDFKSNAQDKLTLHQNTEHTNLNSDGQVACIACENLFNSQHDLIEHTKKDHMKPRLFCDQCNLSFRFKLSLVKHKQHEHENIKYFCDECPQSFNRIDNLKLHKKTIFHGGEKSFKCDQCPASYTNRQPLLAHISSKHSLPN